MKFENYLTETASAKKLAKAKVALMKEFPDVAVSFSKGKDGIGLKVISFDKKLFLKIPIKYMGLPVYKEFQKNAIILETNLTEAKLNFPKDVELFVSKQKTWFQIDNSTSKYLDYNTRRHGNVGEETPGREDVREANRLRQLLLKKFGKAIKVQVDAVDEFTELYITKK